MKKKFEHSSWVFSLAGALVFSCLALPAIIVMNHGSTEGGWPGIFYQIGTSLISLFSIYSAFIILSRKFPSWPLVWRLGLGFLLSLLFFIPLYLFYWKIIIRLWIYGISTSIPTMSYSNQSFATIISIHLPVSLISIMVLYNHHLRKTEIDLAQAQKMIAENALQQLLQQIDPHFLFNNLNILSALIRTHPEQAVLFNDRLAQIYRQLLEIQKETVISVQQELQFAENYYYLLCCRFQDSLKLVIENKSDYVMSDLFMIPLSLQFLIENVVKHNIALPASPLTITICIYNNYVEVSNPIIKKELNGKAGIGLKNLKERYLHLTQKLMSYGEQDGNFKVTLPLLKKLTT